MKVILVDKNNRKVGEEEKMAAHRKAKLHRAFSVFIFNSKKEMLLQKRSSRKYHCGGLWSNACCSHPYPGEKTKSAAKRRLREEMGFETPIYKVFSFIYNEKVGNLTEYEFDYVFVGSYDGTIKPNRREVEDYKYLSLEKLEKDIRKNPSHYTPWLKIALEEGRDVFHKILC